MSLQNDKLTAKELEDKKKKKIASINGDSSKKVVNKDVWGNDKDAAYIDPISGFNLKPTPSKPKTKKELYNIPASQELSKEEVAAIAKGKQLATKKDDTLNSLKTFANNFIDSGNLKKVKDNIFGFEYGDDVDLKRNLDTENELLNDETIIQSVKDNAKKGYEALYPGKKLDQYVVDGLIEDVIKTRVKKNNDEKVAEKKKYQDQQKANGNYAAALNIGINQHIAETTKEEQFIEKGILKAKSLQDILRSKSYTDAQKINAQNELIKLGPALNEKLKNYNKEYSFHFDNVTGRRLSQKEVAARKANGDENSMTDEEKGFKSIVAKQKDQDLESLETGYFTHIAEYGNLQKRLEKKYNINPKTFAVRASLAQKGYKPNANTGEFDNVKIKDIVEFDGSDYALDDIQSNIKGTKPLKRGEGIKYEIQDLVKDKRRLNKEREAYKITYLMNIDPKSIDPSAWTAVGENFGKSLLGEDFVHDYATSDRDRLDYIQKLFQDNKVKATPEQQKAFERDLPMKIAEATGYGAGEALKFYAANKITGGIMGATGLSERLAALGKSNGVVDKTLYHAINALKEEATFKAISKGDSQTGGGAGFYLGGQAIGKILPNNPFYGRGSILFNSIYKNNLQGGLAMVAGSNAATVTEGLIKDLSGNKDFKTTLNENYGTLDHATEKVIIDGISGSLLGLAHVDYKYDFKSVSETRKIRNEVYNEIKDLENAGNAENTSLIKKKKNLLNTLDYNLKAADQNFNKLDINSMMAAKSRAQKELDAGNLTRSEIADREDIIAKTEASVVAAQRTINRTFKATAESGILGDDVKLNIFEGNESPDGKIKMDSDRLAEYDPITNSINVNILKYQKGKYGHEMGHAMLQKAFAADKTISEKFKNLIQETVDKAAANTGGFGKTEDGKNKTLSEVIAEKYHKESKDVQNEEFVMNTLELLQEPKYREAILGTKLLPDLLRISKDYLNKVGIDISSNPFSTDQGKNITNASELLNFIYELGTVAEGKNARSLKNKFEQFKNISIDGEKLIDNIKGTEVTTEKAEINKIDKLASKEIKEQEKKDIFSKATKAYEDAMRVGSSSEVAGLMVGMEMEPLVKKQVESYLAAKGINMSRDVVEDIVRSVTTDSGPGTFGVPNLVEAWSKGQGLIEYIKKERPSREMINSKAKELGIQNRTAAGSEEGTIDKYIKMAEGGTEQAQLTSYVFGNLPKRILQTLQKSEFADVFNTFSVEDVKNIDKLEESAGISGVSGSGSEGYIDVSSPEQYTRLSQKRAEEILGLKSNVTEKVNSDATKFLNSQKLENLDAKAIGRVPLKDGGTAKVAMLESDKARITYPDGTTETIKARSPKIVEQYLGAPDKSFQKQFNFKEGLAEDFKNSLYNDLSKEAGNLINNVKATPQYEAFIDKAFPLFKDYISQSAVNKRFAEFKEPFMDKVTGKQAREKTAAGNPIFTKKNITLAEWRKYFLADGTQRIDGKRRSLLEALAVELGFDATMNVLGQEAMREQIESRQEALSNDLISNYVAVIAKQVDRNSESPRASIAIKEAAEELNMPEEELRFLIPKLLDEKGNLIPLAELFKTEVGSAIWGAGERMAGSDLSNNIEFKRNSDKVRSGLVEKLVERGFKKEDVANFKEIKQLDAEGVKDYEDFVKDMMNNWLKSSSRDLTKSPNGKDAYTIISQFFSYTGRQSFKTNDYFGVNRFRELANNEKGERNTEIDTNVSKNLSEDLNKEWDKWYEDLKALSEGRGDKLLTLSNKANKFFTDAAEIVKSDKPIKEKIKDIEDLGGKKEAITDITVKSQFLELFLRTIGEKSKNLNETDRKKLAKNVAVMMLNNEGFGIRKFSSENYFDLSILIDDTIKNEHLKAKATFGADVIESILDGTLGSKENVKKLVESYTSLLGGKTGQLAVDKLVGTTVENFEQEKMALAQWINLGGKAGIDAKEALSNVYNIKEGKTVWEDLVAKKIVADISEKRASKQIKLDEEISKMIERKTGISSTKELSDAKAQILGRDKGNYKFFVPPNAEDFAGMLYKLYGKGEQGDKDMALLKEKLLDPFEKGENALSHYRQKLANDMKAMDAELNEIGGEVSKESKEALKKSGFDADQATRVYIWTKQGVEIPGITKEEAKELVDIVSNDNRLRNYAKGVMNLVDFPEPTDSWYGSNLKYDLYTYSTEGVRKDFLKQWDENMKEAFTPENYNRMEAAYGKDFVDNFKQLAKRMKTGKAEYENINKVAQKGLDWINGSVGVIMWMNIRSAVLQTTAAFNYVNWGDNNVLAAGKTLTNPVEFAKTFKELINSDFLKQRRDGMEINIEDAEIAKAIEKGGNAPQRLFGKLIKAGFKPTQMADSFAIAVGGTPFYINRTKTYQNEMTTDANGNEVRKYSDAQAKEKAFEDFRSISEENQQSSRQDRVSNVQLGVLGRLIFAFNNTSMQMARLQKKAALDIINQRGDLKTHISKLVYYGVVQNAVFYALQQGMFGMAFGKDDDELKEGEKESIKNKNQDKAIDLANGMIDNILTGAGLTGKLLTTAKNTLLKWQAEAAKENKADYSNVVNEVLSISPPLSSKTKKVSTAFKEIKHLGTKKGQKEVEGTGALNSPYNMPRAKIFSAATNIPLDRLLTKIDNMSTAIAGENVEDWQRIALGFGWDKWSLGMYDKPYLTPEEQKAEDSRIAKEGAATAKITREAKKAKEKAAYDALPQEKKDSIDDAKKRIKDKKLEEKFIKEAIRKASMSPAEIALEKYRKKQERKMKKSSPEYKEKELRKARIKDSINNVIKNR